MNDRDLLALADAVGVLDPNTQYLRQLERLDQRHKQRMDYIKGGVTIAALFGGYVLFAFQTGTTP